MHETWLKHPRPSEIRVEKFNQDLFFSSKCEISFSSHFFLRGTGQLLQFGGRKFASFKASWKSDTGWTSDQTMKNMNAELLGEDPPNNPKSIKQVSPSVLVDVVGGRFQSIHFPIGITSWRCCIYKTPVDDLNSTNPSFSGCCVHKPQVDSTWNSPHVLNTRITTAIIRCLQAKRRRRLKHPHGTHKSLLLVVVLICLLSPESV